ncbi:MAG TPA: DUF3488 and transglutaminase-like domain-containing protein [Thermodesulfobacteriota bacterium]|nr:DUF3488 and transglutaminase-like domain-containing protein [Thermodesulfobacteriota bacterium]
MKVSQALSLFTHLIALIGFFTICVSGQVSVLGITIFLSSLFLSYINERYQKQYYLDQRFVTLLAFALLLYAFLSIVVFGKDAFNVILTFLIYTQVIKLLGRKDMRDYIQIFILSFFHFLAGTILTVDFSYGIAFVVYVSVALWAIIVLSMRKESMEASSNDDPRVVTPLFLSSTVIISFGIFAFTALMFVSIPRLKSGFLTSAFIRPEALKTGFSDEVKLGQVGEIKLDSSPVMRVKILNSDPESLPETIYWRGIALDHFDGTTWRASNRDYKMYKSDPEGVIRVKENGDRVLVQEIVTEPLDTDVIFAGSLPVGFKGIAGGRLAEFNDSYVLPVKLSYRLKYTAYSDLSSPLPRDLREEKNKYPALIKRHYLQLPPMDERISELAREITKLDRNPYDQAVSVKRYLVTNMGYTRTLPPGAGEFPLEDFLFESKAGHCEYFATAMVVLLREVGIPARIVNGFVGGEWNEYGNFFLLRESNAHSWVEVYFPESGWVIFDPTPAGNDSLAADDSLFFIRSYLDYLKYKWSRYVVDFNQQDQVRLFDEFRSGWSWRKNNLENRVDRVTSLHKKWLVGFLLVALVGWTLYNRSDLRYFIGYRSKKPLEKASVIYKKSLSLLSKKGYPKAEHLTPREFARDVTKEGGARFHTFVELTEKYLNLRFGGEAVKSKLLELEALLDRLRKEIK